MAEGDPIPLHLQRAALIWIFYKKMMRLLAVFGGASLLLAFLYFKNEGEAVPIRMIVAIVAGAGLAVAIGTGLMGIMLLGNRRGREAASGRKDVR